MANDYKYIDKSIITEIDDLDSFFPGANMVLVKPVLDTTVAGKHVKLHIDTFFEQIDYARRIVEVLKVPNQLLMKGVNGCPHNSLMALEWHTTMDLLPGDVAWVDPLAVVNNNDTLDTHCYKYNNELYFAIRYDKFICAKRGSERIMLNGYVLVTKKFSLPDTALILEEENTHCQIEFIGKPNISYSTPYYDDHIELKVGDHISPLKHYIPLEGSLHKDWADHTTFYIVQRRNIHVNYKVYEN